MTKKVLVVDDKPPERTATASALKLIGYEVEEAASGLNALKRFIADHYDVILMDYEMPLMSGPQCTQKIREYETGTSAKAFIIGVTTGVNKCIQENCVNAGMDACIDKASGTEEIQRIVNELAMVS